MTVQTMLTTDYIYSNLIQPVWFCDPEELPLKASARIEYFKQVQREFGSNWFRSIECREAFGGQHNRHCYLLSQLHELGLVRRKTREYFGEAPRFEYQIAAILI